MRCNKSTMTIRCNERGKRETASVAEYYGFHLSSVTCVSGGRWRAPGASRSTSATRDSKRRAWIPFVRQSR